MESVKMTKRIQVFNISSGVMKVKSRLICSNPLHAHASPIKVRGEGDFPVTFSESAAVMAASG